jgi:hypothetical protein
MIYVIIGIILFILIIVFGMACLTAAGRADERLGQK